MANLVRDARAMLGWTQTDLARRAGVDLSTITRAEKSLPLSPLTMGGIARALGKSMGDLWPEEEMAS